jgi:CRISPR/Cas system-associated exonuclease Cas4 (RecB family)
VPRRVQLHFVGTGVIGEAEVEPRHLGSARERVIEAAAGIRAAQFPPKPDARHCAYCPYSRVCVHSAARGPA